MKKILEEQGIVIEQIAALASIDVKKEERCLLEFSEKYRIPLGFIQHRNYRQCRENFTVPSS